MNRLTKRWMGVGLLLSTAILGAACENGRIQASTGEDGKFYSLDLTMFDQHQDMTQEACRQANKVSADAGLVVPFLRCDEYDMLIQGNVSTDQENTGWGAWVDENQEQRKPIVAADRLMSQNHHFMREGTESAYSACSKARFEMRARTLLAASEYIGFNDYVRAIYIIGTVTHTIQDSFANAHARRNQSDLLQFLDVCSIHLTIPGVCQHPESRTSPEDDADDQPLNTRGAIYATTEYLKLVMYILGDLKNGREPRYRELDAFLAKWFDCSPLLKAEDQRPVPLERDVMICSDDQGCLSYPSAAGDNRVANAKPSSSSNLRWRISAEGRIFKPGEDRCLLMDQLSFVDRLVVGSCNDPLKRERWTFLNNGGIRHSSASCLEGSTFACKEAWNVSPWTSPAEAAPVCSSTYDCKTLLYVPPYLVVTCSSEANFVYADKIVGTGTTYSIQMNLGDYSPLKACSKSDQNACRSFDTYGGSVLLRRMCGEPPSQPTSCDPVQCRREGGVCSANRCYIR